MKPYKQGDVDGLCGLYSAVNALRLIEERLTLDDCYSVTTDLLVALEKRRGNIANRIIDGLNIHDLNFILKLLGKKYGVSKRIPFYGQSEVLLSTFWNRIKRFFDEGDRRAVIIGYFDNRWDDSHWSVVKKVTDKSIHLFDSCDVKYLLRSKCSTVENNNSSIIVYPKQALFLMKKG